MNTNKLYYLFLTGFLVFFIFINIFGIHILRKYNYFFRAIPVSDMSSLEYSFPCQTPSQIQQLCGSTHQETLKNVMNFVSCKNKSIVPLSDNVQSFFECAKNEGVLTCNGMAELYLHALRLQGVKARKLFVVKNFGDPYQSHTTVEIFIDGKWRIFDPTFHVSFKKNDQLLGAQDIAESIIDGSFSKIEPVFYGEVNYSCRLDSYYMHWLSLYNNILLFKYPQPVSSVVQKLMQQLTRYWNGPVLYYFSQDGLVNRYFEILNRVYFLIICILPLMIILIVFLLLLIILIEIYKKRICILKKGEHVISKCISKKIT